MCRCHELAYGVTSINPVMGPVLNPYNVTRIPGGQAAEHMPLLPTLPTDPRVTPGLTALSMHGRAGSTGGSGVALATRSVTGSFCTGVQACHSGVRACFVSHHALRGAVKSMQPCSMLTCTCMGPPCTDTGGSCRIPASLNGVAGLRPSWGCYVNDDGIIPLSSTRDTPGLCAASTCLSIHLLSSCRMYYGVSAPACSPATASRHGAAKQAVSIMGTSGGDHPASKSTRACHAGVMARTVSDIALFNAIFSSCNTTAVNVSLSGYRIGYPTNWWANISAEVRSSLSACASAMPCARHTLLTSSNMPSRGSAVPLMPGLTIAVPEVSPSSGRVPTGCLPGHCAWD